MGWRSLQPHEIWSVGTAQIGYSNHQCCAASLEGQRGEFGLLSDADLLRRSKRGPLFSLVPPLLPDFHPVSWEHTRRMEASKCKQGWAVPVPRGFVPSYWTKLSLLPSLPTSLPITLILNIAGAPDPGAGGNKTPTKCQHNSYMPAWMPAKCCQVLEASLQCKCSMPTTEPLSYWRLRVCKNSFAPNNFCWN